MDRNKIPQDPRHLGVSSGASKMISEPMVCSVQTVHLSCVKISTISKRTKMCFRLSLITLEYHRVHQKRFLSLWYVRCKPCTHLASILALSPNRPKWASTWALSSSNSIECIENNFLPYGTFAELVHPKWFLSLWYVRRKPCTYLASRLSVSTKQNKIRFYMTHVTK
jgi:hypothetical protein